MKTIRLFGTIMIAVLLLSGCSKNDNDETVDKSPANAKGIIIRSSETLDCYFWINEYVIQVTGGEEYEDLSKFRFDNIPYYPFTMERLYSLLSDYYGYEINESNYDRYGVKTVDYMKRQMSIYKYISSYDGSAICLFNRISSVNYSK